MVENDKPRRLSTFERGPRHQNYAKMNVRIFEDAMVMQRWIDKKIVSCVHAKA